MRVALLTPEKHESTVDLLCELHAHYNESSTVSREVVRSHLVDHLLAADSALRLAVASRDDSSVIGFAAVSLIYSLVEPAPEKRRQCTVKELFASRSQRSKGTGKALMAWVAQYATANQCCRIDWSANAANQRGISFYEGLGAERVAERLSYRISGKRMVGLAPKAAAGARKG